MMQVIRSAERFSFDSGWLQTRWHFSFGHYYDPANVGFGTLRVFNDDVVQPGGGFPTHGHAEMEIVTYVLDGALEHRDSAGGHGVLRAGDVQHMCAGRGVRHSEFNGSQERPVHFLQVWIEPRKRGVTPRYEQQHVEPAMGRLSAVASGWGDAGALPLEADAAMYVGRVAVGAEVRQPLRGSRAYAFVIDGAAELQGERLERGDQARIQVVSDIVVRGGDKGAHVMVIDLA